MEKTASAAVKPRSLALLAVAAVCAIAGYVGAASRPREDLEAKRNRLSIEKALLEEHFDEAISGNLVPPTEATDDLEAVVAVPNSLLRQVLKRVVTDGINGLSLRVRGAEFHLQKQLRARLLIPKVRVGGFDLDVVLQDVRGDIEAEAPTVQIRHGAIGLEAPFKIMRGEGRVLLRFRWAGRPITKLLCRNMDLVVDAHGSLLPLQVDFRGQAFLGMRDGQFVIDPAIPTHRFLLNVVPSDDAWEQVRNLVASRRGTCRAALKRIDVEKKLRKLLAKGFPITVHTERLATVRLPLAMSGRVLTSDGKELNVRASAAMLEIGGAHVWLGTDLSVSRVPAAP